MLLRSIRSRLLGLVLATVIPLVAVILGGLGSQLRDDQDEATERVLDEARLLAAQVDNHIGNLENLLLGVSQAVSPRLADTGEWVVAVASPVKDQTGRLRAVIAVGTKL